MPGFANLGHDQLEAVFEYVYYGKETTVKDMGHRRSMLSTSVMDTINSSIRMAIPRSSRRGAL